MRSGREQTTPVSVSLPTDTNNAEKFEYLKKNPDRFLENFFGIKFFWYHRILLKIIAKEKRHVSIIK